MARISVPAADGATLIATLADAPPGTEIILLAGTFVLGAPLELDRPLTLVGAGLDATRLECAANGTVAAVIADVSLSIRGVTIAHVGDARADVVRVDAGYLMLEACRLTGARRGSTDPDSGHGVVVRGRARLDSTRCQIVGNDWHGIAYLGDGSGTARENRCQDNRHGIAAGGSAEVELVGNICHGNLLSGIAFLGRAGGTVRENTCQANGDNGIAVVEAARPELVGNVCHSNLGAGIDYSDDAGGAARENRCRENHGSGIAVGESAAPELIRNTCRANALSGIDYFGDARGAARENVCQDNQEHGIAVGETAAPELIGNACRANTGAGIDLSERAGGKVQENACERNGIGIRAEGGVRALIDRNECRDNRSGDLVRERRSVLGSLRDLVRRLRPGQDPLLD
ncbi:MAG TPA: right-handed parallel beta-helix repeat-containing protein [Chloroflexota bacterium]|nr:right-handed parallel beta-helix repeat-containing protein [Chloroflexota bacterium]